MSELLDALIEQRKKEALDYQEYLKRLAKDAGIEDPTNEDLRKFDKKREDKNRRF